MAAPMKLLKRGCGSKGRDFSSGLKLHADEPGMVLELYDLGPKPVGGQGRKKEGCYPRSR
jgi:hypothetical protein